MDWLAQLCGLPDKFLFSRADAGADADAAPPNGPAAGAAPRADMAGATADAAAAAAGPGGGVIQGTSSEGVLVAMLAARARAMRGRPPEDAVRLVAYGSDQARAGFEGCTAAGGGRAPRPRVGEGGAGAASQPGRSGRASLDSQRGSAARHPARPARAGRAARLAPSSAQDTYTAPPPNLCMCINI
jgi:hypothetical protein